ncbi:DnaJ C-terminal domain-containing protein [Asticcacaulis sp. ZE23SCel15]|uniref:DnaJ C-terminal domain-containing protein n=1 Tax=Asticcacaulis sp. ZE23SCel15 TaxID=3059027 RepID=UPI00265FF2D0|nr:DnaJ C-terminal domain-containing protein [Asticcacaulis sp. ZE23SCel15]WKL56529.1 DnaJ C-terminal domain-containing protein [Asticcacaulis sp. ZE23SCel15]
MNRTDALKILGLCDPIDEARIKAAFRARVKDVHPDINPTSDALLRLMIVARDILLQQSVPASVAHHSPAVTDLVITPHQAIHGGEIVCEIPVTLDIIEQDQTVQSLSHLRHVSLHLPKGLRHDEILELKDGQLCPVQSQPAHTHNFQIKIILDERITIAGNDIWMTVGVSPDILKNGGQAMVETPNGTRPITLQGPVKSGSSLKLAGAGLPARAGFKAGDLHLRLTEKEVPSFNAANLLNRFNAQWG